MDVPPVNQHHDTGADAGSDYGSDFTAEEENLVNELLGKLPLKQDTCTNLAVTSIVDDEDPGVAKVPRTLGRERWSKSDTPLSTVEEAGVPIKVDGNGSTAKGEDRLQPAEKRLTDHQALSRER